jgi:hypothetical protein
LGEAWRDGTGGTRPALPRLWGKVPANRVPPKFEDPETSDLTAEVKAEDNNLTIELK